MRHLLSTIALASLLLLPSGNSYADTVLLEVELGSTVEQNVFYARGWLCDDPSLVQAELITRDDHNVWRVKGVKLGTTLCRVGTVPYQASYFFDLHVVPKKPPPKPTSPPPPPRHV